MSNDLCLEMIEMRYIYIGVSSSALYGRYKLKEVFTDCFIIKDST